MIDSTKGRLTLEVLIAAGACDPATQAFQSQWPGEPPTWAEVAQALAKHPRGVAGWHWLLYKRLVPTALAADYEGVRAAAMVEYERARTAAWAECLPSAAWNEYRQAITVVAKAGTERERGLRAWLRSV